MFFTPLPAASPIDTPSLYMSGKGAVFAYMLAMCQKGLGPQIILSYSSLDCMVESYQIGQTGLPSCVTRVASQMRYTFACKFKGLVGDVEGGCQSSSSRRIQWENGFMLHDFEVASL